MLIGIMIEEPKNSNILSHRARPVCAITFQNMVSSQPVSDAHKTLFDAGLQAWYEVAGKAYVDRALQNGSSECARPMQELATEGC